jgi:hypothetical protein
MHIGIAAAKGRQRIGNRLDKGGRGGKADAQLAGFAVVKPSARGSIIDLREDLPAIGEKLLPGAVRLTLRLVRANRRAPICCSRI